MKTKRKRKPSLDEIPISIHIVEADTQCVICDAEFLDAEDLQVHIAQVHSNSLVTCKFCSTKLSGLDEYTTHFINSHLEMALVCNYCHRTFLEPACLREHESKHCSANSELLTCSQCVIKFASRYELRKHEYEVHSNINDGVLLNEIYSLLSSALNMQATKFLDALAKNKPVSCLMCNHYSTSIIDYVDHLKKSYCKSITCDKCLRVYKKKRGLTKHLTNHPQCQNIGMDVIKVCKQCEKKFNKHEISIHSKSCSAKKCKSCGVICMSVYELAEHQIKEHKISQAVTVLACTYCKKEFAGHESLKKHMDRVHHNQHLYKYRCIYCDAVFKHPKNLLAHFYTKHKDISPYTCKICNMKFKLRKKFTIHIKLDHKSIGSVEFDDNLHVIFTDKKSENSVTATSEGLECTDKSIVDTEKSKNETKENEDYITTTTNKTEIINAIELLRDVSEINSSDNDDSEGLLIEKPSKVEPKKIEQKPTKINRNIKVRTSSRINKRKQLESDSEFSEDEPLIKIKKKTNKAKNISSMLSQKQARRMRDKTEKLTCKKCNKYCYTFQNYHHHMSLHEKNKMKKCIKCSQRFKSKDELNNHINKAHSSSKLTETLKSLLEKRKKNQPFNKNSNVRPADTIKSVLEQRKKAMLISLQNSPSYKFGRTIKKVEMDHDTSVTITPITNHGLSVKRYIENFKPEVIQGLSIYSSVTFKALTMPNEKTPFIKLRKFREEPILNSTTKLRFPEKFKDIPAETVSNVTVKLVQELLTKPRPLNITFNEHVEPTRSPTPDEYSDYCNTFADETDYTQYKNDPIPEVAHEVMLGEADDIPKTRQLAQEIFIPKIPEEHGEVRIGHLMPKAPFYKIVKVKKLLKPPQPEKDPAEENKMKGIELPDGTQLVTVKNPFSHLIPNDHLQKVVKANTNKYYTPKVKNIEHALITALQNLNKPRAKPQAKRKKKSNMKLNDTDSNYSFQTVDTNETFEMEDTKDLVVSSEFNRTESPLTSDFTD